MTSEARVLPHRRDAGISKGPCADEYAKQTQSPVGATRGLVPTVRNKANLRALGPWDCGLEGGRVPWRASNDKRVHPCETKPIGGGDWVGTDGRLCQTKPDCRWHTVRNKPNFKRIGSRKQPAGNREPQDRCAKQTQFAGELGREWMNEFAKQSQSAGAIALNKANFALPGRWWAQPPYRRGRDDRCAKQSVRQGKLVQSGRIESCPAQGSRPAGMEVAESAQSAEELPLEAVECLSGPLPAAASAYRVLSVSTVAVPGDWLKSRVRAIRTHGSVRGVEACCRVRSCGTLETERQEQWRTQTLPTRYGQSTSTRPICRGQDERERLCRRGGGGDKMFLAFGGELCKMGET